MIDKFFDSNNLIWRGMDKIFDVFILNSLWLLCCLPIFTIGPSTIAFYYSMINLIYGEEKSISKDFFYSFKQNFKQGISLGLLLTIIGIFLIADVFMCYKSGTGIYTFFMAFFLILFFLWAFIALYSFPLLAKFDKTNKDILIWAFVLSMKHVGRTILMLILPVVGIWLCHILHGLIFIAFGLVGEFQVILMCPILKPYLPDTESEDTV